MSNEKVIGSCDKCGRPVRIGGEEGRVQCDGCNLPTDNCTCDPQG